MDRERGWLDNACFSMSMAAPTCLGALGVTAAAPASHDANVVRVCGLGWTGLFRGIDVFVASAAMLLPIGTRALRAGLASALVTGACGALTFLIARQVLDRVRGPLGGGAPPAASWRSVVALVASLSAVLSPMWQTEASAPGGSALGALLVLAALAMASNERAEAPVQKRHTLALLLGFAASYEPLVLASTAVAMAPWSLAGATRARVRGSALGRVIAMFFAGLSPIALSALLLERSPASALATASVFASPLGEGLRGAPPRFDVFAMSEIGPVMLIAAAAGLGLAAFAPASRRLLAALVGVTTMGAIACILHAPHGEAHIPPVILAASSALHALAAPALAAAVAVIHRAKVPFARASAAMVLVLELVLPVRAVDDTLARRESRNAAASHLWNDVAWSAGAVPPFAVLLAADAALYTHTQATRATGHRRPDLLVVPMFAPFSQAGEHVLRQEPKLAPLYRDLALNGLIRAPEELSLTLLAERRPLLAGFEPSWDRALARHFNAAGLFARFEPEPQSASTRHAAFDVFAAQKERLTKAMMPKRDADLVAMTVSLLRARAITMAATGEREALTQAVDDLRASAPDDDVAKALVRRMVTTKGAIDVMDLGR